MRCRPSQSSRCRYRSSPWRNPPGGRQDGYLLLDMAQFAAAFAADLDPATAAFMADTPGAVGS